MLRPQPQHGSDGSLRVGEPRFRFQVSQSSTNLPSPSLGLVLGAPLQRYDYPSSRRIPFGRRLNVRYLVEQSWLPCTGFWERSLPHFAEGLGSISRPI